MNDWIGLLISVVYIFGLIGLAEYLRRRRGYSNDFTRKVIHIGVGMLSWALPFLFDEPWLFIFACIGFMILNILDWRYGFFSAMASSNHKNLGTVYFPFGSGRCCLSLLGYAAFDGCSAHASHVGGRPGSGYRQSLWAPSLPRSYIHSNVRRIAWLFHGHVRRHWFALSDDARIAGN